MSAIETDEGCRRVAIARCCLAWRQWVDIAASALLLSVAVVLGVVMVLNLCWCGGIRPVFAAGGLVAACLLAAWMIRALWKHGAVGCGGAVVILTRHRQTDEAGGTRYSVRAEYRWMGVSLTESLRNIRGPLWHVIARDSRCRTWRLGVSDGAEECLWIGPFPDTLDSAAVLSNLGAAEAELNGGPTIAPAGDQENLS